jgi:hypothetical protein
MSINKIQPGDLVTFTERYRNFTLYDTKAVGFVISTQTLNLYNDIVITGRVLRIHSTNLVKNSI